MQSKMLCDKCTILINSCDSHEDIWPAFFGLMSANWADCPCDIILNTEHKSYSYNGKRITKSVLEENQNAFWCERYLLHLAVCKTEYVFVFLDDDFIQNTVSNAQLLELIDHMESDRQIACFDMRINNGRDCVPCEWENINQEMKDAFRFVLNCTLWRKSYLVNYLKHYAAEDPWKLEGDGMKRSHRWNEKFYAYATDKDRLIKCYCQYQNGFGVWGGQWLWNNKMLFKNNGIEVDMSKRPILEKMQAHEKRQNDIAVSQTKKSAMVHIFDRLHFILYKMKWWCLNRVIGIRQYFRARRLRGDNKKLID